MKAVFLKRQCAAWGYTFLGLILLFGVGLTVGLGFGDQPIQLSSPNDTGFLIWRLTAYCGLITLWPAFIARLARSDRQLLLSRRPLVLLILAYELLLVQNPLALLLQWLR